MNERDLAGIIQSAMNEEQKIKQMMQAIDILGRDEMLGARFKAIQNKTVETLEIELTVLGGNFRASFTFDGTK